MSSLVLELQQEAMNSSVAVSDLLRKAVVVATKLGIKEFKQWANDELNGIEGKGLSLEELNKAFPYRCLNAQIMARNPMRGWIPVMFESAEMQQMLSQTCMVQPISQLEHLIQDVKSDAVLSIPFPPDVAERVFSDNRSYRMGIVPAQIIQPAQIKGVLDGVRNVVLNWSLKLEQDGILGEGMTFSPKEKIVASNNTYNIQNFTGVLGEINSGNVQIGDSNQLHTALKTIGISEAERDKLRKIMNQMETADETAKASLVKQGITWISRNAKQLGTLSEALRKWFQS